MQTDLTCLALLMYIIKFFVPRKLLRKCKQIIIVLYILRVVSILAAFQTVYYLQYKTVSPPFRHTLKKLEIALSYQTR